MMKIVGKAARNKLLQYMRPSFRAAQGGAVPGMGLEMAQLLVKTHLRRLKQERASGAIIFAD